MPSHEPFGGIRRTLIDVEGAPYGHHQREQKQREADAQHSQNAAPLVAEGISHDKASNRHCTYPMWRRPCTMLGGDAWYAERAAQRNPTTPPTSMATSHSPGVIFGEKKLKIGGGGVARYT